jgi:hypothetical protein
MKAATQALINAAIIGMTTAKFIELPKTRGRLINPH